MAIKRRLNYIQRLIATAICYSAFGLGGLLIYAQYPVLGLLPISIDKKRHYGRRLIHYNFRVFIGLMHRLGIFTYEVHGIDKLKAPGQLIVANHPTLIDVVFLLSFIPETNCIVRHGLSKNLFTRGPIKTAGYIVNKDPEQFIIDCTDTLRQGHSLMIFPEGTRTRPNAPMTFKKGTANIALRAAAAVRPVIITCNPPMLQKGMKWYKIPQTRPHFIIRVEESFDITRYLNKEKTIGIQSRRLTQDLLHYFQQKLEKDN